MRVGSVAALDRQPTRRFAMSVVRRVLSLDREVEQAEKTSGSVEVCVVGPATGVPTPELEIGLWSLRGASPSVRIPRMHRLSTALQDWSFPALEL